MFQYCVFLANIKTSSTLLKLPRFSKYYEIQKRPQNIISLRMQTSYGLTLLADVLLFDQIKIFILLAYKSYFGSESTFGIWLFGLVLDILGKKQIPNTYSYIFSKSVEISTLLMPPPPLKVWNKIEALTTALKCILNSPFETKDKESVDWFPSSTVWKFPRFFHPSLNDV